MQNRALITAVCLWALSNVVPAQEAAWKPEDGYVPTAEVAIKIAVAVWEPIYGKKQIADEQPYHASLAKGVWTVRGSLPRGIPGGVAVAQISRKDGKVLQVFHEQ